MYHYWKRQEIQLFHGIVGKSCGLNRVVAIPIDAMIHLRFKEGKKKALVVRLCTIVPLSVWMYKSTD